MKHTKPSAARKKWPLNLAFAGVSLALLAFLLAAPEESTTRLPHDEVHQEFHLIESKKKAESTCASCHSPDSSAPLPADHPPPYRCLFCHKRN